MMTDQSPLMHRFDRKAVDTLRKRADVIFGANEVANLLAMHRQADPPVRHRFADLMNRLEDAADGKLSPVAEDAAMVGLAEVDSVLTFAEEWLGSAAWPEVRRGLRAPGAEYLHSVGTLAVGSLLRVRHPTTDIVVASGQGRQADLRLSVPDVVPMVVEVKTPQALWQPSSSLDLGQATLIVGNAIAAAGTNASGQLPPGHPGILAIAGLLISQQTYDTLVTGFEIVLSANGKLWPQLLGLAVFNLRQGVLPENGRVSVTLEQQSVIRRNPSYAGSLWIDDDWSKPWSLAEQRSR
jgi:hypothetical protein